MRGYFFLQITSLIESGRIGITYNHVDPLVLIAVEATWVSIAIANYDVLLAVIYKSPSRDWNDVDITGLVSFTNETISAGGLNAEHSFWIVKFQYLQARNVCSYFIVTSHSLHPPPPNKKC
jgi:hypothetical protein